MANYRRLLISVFFLCLYGFGLIIFRDYGFATDEQINRENGGVSLRYVISIIQNISGVPIDWGNIRLSGFYNDLLTYRDRDYGVAFDLPAMFFERIFNLNASRDQYLFRHALTHFIFIASLWAFYAIIKDRFNDYRIALIGVAFMLFSPRIYAESFYNNKDIVFMSLFTIGLFFSLRLLRHTNIKYALLASLFTALAINVRIIAIILPAIVLTALIVIKLSHGGSLRQTFKVLAIYFLLTVSLVVFLWPWLWSDPLGHFLEAFRNMAKFRWLNWVLYRGHYYPSTELPWHYLPVWISITTPLHYLVFCVLGFAVILFFSIKNILAHRFSVNILTDLIFISILIAPAAAAIMLRSTLYDGWRQFYFIYPALIYIASYGFNSAWEIGHASRIYRLGFAVLLFSCMAGSAAWMIRNHPFQNVYFNLLGGPDWISRYESDYWGLSNTNGLQFIAGYDPREKIKVFGLGNTALPQARLILPAQLRERFIFVTSIEAADYLLTNFRFLNWAEEKNLLNYVDKQFDRVYEIKVDKNAILAIYKANR
jgi:hypothetical protein